MSCSANGKNPLQARALSLNQLASRAPYPPGLLSGRPADAERDRGGANVDRRRPDTLKTVRVRFRATTQGAAVLDQPCSKCFEQPEKKRHNDLPRISQVATPTPRSVLWALASKTSRLRINPAPVLTRTSRPGSAAADARYCLGGSHYDATYATPATRVRRAWRSPLGSSHFRPFRPSS